MSNYRLFISIIIILAFFSFCSDKKEVNKSSIDLETASWPIFRGDPTLSGIAHDELPDKLTLLWSFKTESEIISSPVIGFGRAYIGSTDGKVYSINLIDGKKIWEFDTGDDIEASPLILGDSIYIGSLNGDFFSLDAQSGQVHWKYKMEDSVYGSANYAKVPNSQEWLVLVGCYDNRMYCFNAGTGKLKWTYETDDFINGAPATDGEVVIFGGCDEKLHIISVLDGTKKGDVRAGSPIPGSAALVDKRAYFGHYDNQLVCIDIIKKKILWIYEDKENGGPFFSTPAVGEDFVVVGSRDYRLHCIDRETGEKIWTFKTRDEIDSSPVIAGDKVIAASLDGRIYVVSLKDGKEIWTYEIGAMIIGCPAVAGGIILVGAEDGRVYAFGGKS